MNLNVDSFISSLSAEERIHLLTALQKITGTPYSGLTQNESFRAEIWFTRNMEKAKSKYYAHAKTRMWMIFMLLRHGGLRLREIMALHPEDCMFSQSFILANKRKVPLSREVGSRLGKVWHSWIAHASAFPFQCESSQVRRSLARCAAACSIRSGFLNASGLRRLRGHELEAEGLHPRLVAWFLGKTTSAAPYSEELASYIIETHIATGGKMKTSARNLFQGQIMQINENGILVEVILETEKGLQISALITKTSCESMGLAAGKVVNALVKAPWMSVLPLSDRARAADVNCFEAKVDKIRKDDMACEILATLARGNQICALYANGASPSSKISEGSEIVVSFSPFSVILMVN